MGNAGTTTNSNASIFLATKLGIPCESHAFRTSSSRGWLRNWGKPRLSDWSSSYRDVSEKESQLRSRLERGERENKTTTYSMRVEEDVRSPRSAAGPEPENLPLADVEEDADGGVASDGKGRKRVERSACSRTLARQERRLPPHVQVAFAQPLRSSRQVLLAAAHSRADALAAEEADRRTRRDCLAVRADPSSVSLKDALERDRERCELIDRRVAKSDEGGGGARTVEGRELLEVRGGRVGNGRHRSGEGRAV
jgi:hypothetical protein